MCLDVRVRSNGCGKNDHEDHIYIQCFKATEYQLGINLKGCPQMRTKYNTINQPCSRCVLSLVCSKVVWLKDLFDAERKAQWEEDRGTEYGNDDLDNKDWWAGVRTPTGSDTSEVTTDSSSADDGGFSPSGKDDSWSEASSVEEETKVELDWNKGHIDPKKPKYGW